MNEALDTEIISKLAGIKEVQDVLLEGTRKTVIARHPELRDVLEAFIEDHKPAVIDELAAATSRMFHGALLVRYSNRIVMLLCYDLYWMKVAPLIEGHIKTGNEPYRFQRTSMELWRKMLKEAPEGTRSMMLLMSEHLGFPVIRRWIRDQYIAWQNGIPLAKMEKPVPEYRRPFKR